MGCFGERKPLEKDVKLPDQVTMISDPASLSGFIYVREFDEWRHRLTIITGCGLLVIYSDSHYGKTYNLMILKSLKMDRTDDMIFVRLVTRANRKLKLKLCGVSARNWAARIVRPDGKMLGHGSHFHRPKTALSSSQESRFSYSMPLSSSDESIPRLLNERQTAGRVHSILTDNSISMVEKRVKMYEIAGRRKGNTESGQTLSSISYDVTTSEEENEGG